MRQAILLLAPLLASCGGGDGAGRGDGGGSRTAAVQTADLTGLYEGPGEGERRPRLCMISQAAGTAEFGLVVEGGNGSCGGAGEAVRTESLVRLTMSGDEECAIDARIEGTKLTFPSRVPESCAYYCGPGATLAGGTFEKTGGSPDDAMRATDLAGDPLCG